MAGSGQLGGHSPAFVDRATLDEGKWAEDGAGRPVEGLSAVDHDQQARVSLEPPLDEVAEQGPHHLFVLGVS
jgi:hypothetical protein